ncbi:MAG TPA: DUF177 domain-containing protein [Abditibacteriaceae bacterium]|nr:DUF177 domain-containing protein [Abditibacteriaceae bacterium]
MYLDLTDVLRDPGNVVERPIDLPPRTLDDVEFVQPVRGFVRAENARHNVVVSGKVSTAIVLPCARCLKSYTQPLDLDLEANAPLSFFRAHVTGEVDEDTDPDDEFAALFDVHTVDVLELIRQAAVLQSPIKPLCAEDCPGLPEAATYTDAPADERWKALQDLSQQN